MTREEALAQFQKARDELTTVDAPTTGPPTQAFVGGTAPGPVVTGQPPDLSQPAGQDIPGMALSVGAGMAGETAAMKAIKSLPIPAKYKVPAEIAAAAVGGGVAAFGTDLGYQNLRRALGDPGAPDNFDSSLAISLKTGSDQMMGGAWGQALGGAVGKTSLKAKVDDERLAQMKEVQASMKRTYERIGGQPMVEDMRGRWNPMRILRPLKTELDDQSAVSNLKKAGLDPVTARRVVLQGGMTSADLLDNTPYAILQAVSEGSFSGKKYMQKYQGTRSRLYELMLDDLSNEFSAAVPEEKLGKTVAQAVDGNFNLPNAVMNAAMGNVKSQVKPDYKINMKGVKGYFTRQGILPGSTVGQMIYDLPNDSTFDAVHQVRSNLSTLIHAQDTDPKVVDEAKRVAKTLDNSMTKQLPFEVQDHYKLAVNADDVLNEGQFKSRFVRGLMGTEEGYRAYAKYLLKQGDVENFYRLEASAGRDAADKVRRGISESVVQNAVLPDGTMNPASLHQALNEHGKYGRYFLESTLGPQWMKDAERLKGSMETLLETARGRSLSDMGLGSLKYASVAPLLWDLYHGQLDKNTVAEAALLFTGPKFLARAITSPRATANIERLSRMAKTGTNPHTFSRLVARTAEAVGITPEDLLAAGNTPGVTRMQKMRADLAQGRMPSVGNPIADAMISPGQALGDIGSGNLPGQDTGPAPGAIQ